MAEKLQTLGEKVDKPAFWFIWAPLFTGSSLRKEELIGEIKEIGCTQLSLNENTWGCVALTVVDT